MGKICFFEVTKENKINRINQLKLNFFIDDLESILQLIVMMLRRSYITQII